MRLECANCKSIFKDVERVRRCPLCSNTSFVDVEPIVPIAAWSRSGFAGNVGFYLYAKNLRMDPGAFVDGD